MVPSQNTYTTIFPITTKVISPGVDLLKHYTFMVCQNLRKWAQMQSLKLQEVLATMYYTRNISTLMQAAWGTNKSGFGPVPKIWHQWYKWNLVGWDPGNRFFAGAVVHQCLSHFKHNLLRAQEQPIPKCKNWSWVRADGQFGWTGIFSWKKGQKIECICPVGKSSGDVGRIQMVLAINEEIHATKAHLNHGGQ